MLSTRDRTILEFEIARPVHNGGKEELIRSTFQMKAPVYYAILSVVLENPEALAAFPVEVNRIRRVWASKVRRRASRGFAA